MSDKLREAAKRVADLIEHDNPHCAFAADILRAALAEPAIKESLIAQRPWVGLTGTEINHIFSANVGYPERMMKEVEVLLKDKNS